MAFVTIVVAVVLLLGSSVSAILATGLGRTATVNLSLLEPPDPPRTVAALKADEAHIWNDATQLILETSKRRAYDLYRARRLIVLALALALLGLTLLVFSVGGRPDILLGGGPAPSPSPMVSGPPTP
ncbi:MAG TPA: hypothetical protein VKR30_06430 [Candidatus Limnocylindrales bacterium]|nr:hypothetical protein [Candidatus Limnocylindrales bacterium]